MTMRLCSGAGCGRAIPEGTRYCHECAPEHRTAVVDRSENDPIMAQYRTARWQTFRRLVLQRYPFCVDCNAVSKVADHDVPARLIVQAVRIARLFPYDDWAGFYILDNMRGRCHACHNKKGKTEDQRDWTTQLTTLLAKYSE